MESTDQHLARIDQRLARLEKKIDILVRAKKAEEQVDQWIDEAEASKIMKWGGQYLRQQAKTGKIAVRSKNVRGRNWKYFRADIERLIREW